MRVLPAILGLAPLLLACSGFGQRIEDIVSDVSALGDGSLTQARVVAQQQIAGLGPLYRSAKKDDRKTFSGRYTPPELPEEKKGRYVYGMAVFSDDGCDVSVRGAPLHAALGKGQHLPDLGQSFKALPVALLPGEPVDVSVSYSNIVYMDDPKGPDYPDVDGCTLFLFLIATELVPDKNRDGVIDEADRGKVSKEKPFRWWVNDDDDDGELAHEDIPLGISSRNADAALGNNHVDGLCDLIDWFPLWFDLKQLIEVFPTDQYQYFLRQKHAALNFAYTDLKPAEVGNFLRHGETAEGLSKQRSFIVLADGTAQLSSDFLAGSRQGKGVLLMEGGNISKEPLWLEIRNGGKQVFEYPFHIRLDEVKKMYRWINVREAAGQRISRTTNSKFKPENFPDDESNGKMFIFVHGYSVNERQSEGSVSDAFKRLYQSGSNAMFTGVSWHGDSSQVSTPIPFIGGLSADFWENVTNVFKSSAALAEEIKKLPGSTKVSAAHSLGNMLVASAIKDFGAEISAHFMFDAAIAIEAFDPSVRDLPAMQNPVWAPYERKLWAAEWHSLFDSSDGRSKLTWRNRFGPMPALHNFYSSGEDVLDNSNGTIPIKPNGAERIWAVQEMVKGTIHPGALITLDSQGGWGFNDAWVVWETQAHPTDISPFSRPYTVAEANAISAEDLKTRPFFKSFQDRRLTTPNGSVVATDYVTRGKALAEAIPALSFASGRNRAGVLQEQNYELMSHKNDDGAWPKERLRDTQKGNRWLHGDAKDVAYRFNYLLYLEWVKLGALE